MPSFIIICFDTDRMFIHVCGIPAGFHLSAGARAFVKGERFSIGFFLIERFCLFKLVRCSFTWFERLPVKGWFLGGRLVCIY